MKSKGERKIAVLSRQIFKKNHWRHQSFTEEVLSFTEIALLLPAKIIYIGIYEQTTSYIV